MKPAEQATRRWNVHVHALVQLREAQRLRSPALDALWRELLAAKGCPGDGHATTLRSHWALHSDPRSPGVQVFLSKPAFYVTKRKPGHDLPALTPGSLDAFLRSSPSSAESRVSAAALQAS